MFGKSQDPATGKFEDCRSAPHPLFQVVMKPYPEPLDLKRVKVYPLAQRQSLSEIGKLLVDPTQPPRQCSSEMQAEIERCAKAIVAARDRNASVMLIYGAHLIKNGALLIVN